MPGGGKNLEASAAVQKVLPPVPGLIKQEVVGGGSKGEASGGKIAYPTSWPSSSATASAALAGLTASQIVKQEKAAKGMASAARTAAAAGGMSINLPSPLLDTSLFLRMGENNVSQQTQQQQPMAGSNPLDSITQNFFAKFLSSPTFSNPNFAQVYNALLGSNISAASILNSINPALLGLANMQKPKVPAYNPMSAQPPNNTQWNGVMANANYQYLQNPHNPLGLEEDEEGNDDDAMGVADTYADYKPAKCNFHTIHHSIVISSLRIFFVGFI